MSNEINDFINRYGVKHIQRVEPRRREYYTTASQQVSYHFYDDRDEIVEMELPYRCFQHLVERDNEFDYYRDVEYRNKRMRQNHPEIQEAYEKYLLMLELYR
jgi:hypothetical protein